jgi:hypothetical protein
MRIASSLSFVAVMTASVPPRSLGAHACSRSLARPHIRVVRGHSVGLPRPTDAGQDDSAARGSGAWCARPSCSMGRGRCNERELAWGCSLLFERRNLALYTLDGCSPVVVFNEMSTRYVGYTDMSSRLNAPLQAGLAYGESVSAGWDRAVHPRYTRKRPGRALTRTGPLSQEPLVRRSD